ncbi:MAG: glycerate kinase [Treponema sp.]|nr:glycerate kinase [Treponema sp.]
MKIIIAPDSFKGNMSAPTVCSKIEEGILRACKKAKVFKIPLADGGEGTARAVTEAAGGKFVEITVKGPLGKPHKAAFGLLEKGKVAVLDMASASGLELISKGERNPMKACSYGTGELMKAALDSGARELIIGIGGSATNDGGIGMLSALGFRFLDERGNPVGFGGEALARIAKVDCSGADKRLKGVSIKVACDVTNPLLGPKGASATFGPQKGATPDLVRILDSGLAKLGAAWIKAGLAKDVEQPGDGAAGGMGAALRICLGAKMESGAMLVMRYAGFFKCLEKGVDLVITGEGQTDDQTAGGKLCSVVARESRKAKVPVALLSGALAGENARKLLSSFDYAASVSCGETSLDAMLKNGPQNLTFAAENLTRAILMGNKPKASKPAKKAPEKKAPLSKAPPKKTSPKKAAAEKTAKKAGTKKVVPKKAPLSKAPPKKAAAKKAPKKAVPKKAAAKKAGTKKK